MKRSHYHTVTFQIVKSYRPLPVLPFTCVQQPLYESFKRCSCGQFSEVVSQLRLMDVLLWVGLDNVMFNPVEWNSKQWSHCILVDHPDRKLRFRESILSFFFSNFQLTAFYVDEKGLGIICCLIVEFDTPSTVIPGVGLQHRDGHIRCTWSCVCNPHSRQIMLFCICFLLIHVTFYSVTDKHYDTLLWSKAHFSAHPDRNNPVLYSCYSSLVC